MGRFFRGPRLGGDAVLARLDSATGGADAYTFSYGDSPDGLHVHAYFVDEPVPHILYCTYGLSRVASSQRVAGTQTELTMRVPDADFPHQWPADQLTRMARRIRRTGHEIAPGHHMATPNGPVPAYVFVTDPVLGVIDGPTGLIRFTYAVGLADDDFERMLRWDPVKFAGVVGDAVPLGLTDPNRRPISDNPEIRTRLDGAAEGEGSSISAMLAEYLAVDAGGRVDLDPEAARALLRGARYRLRFGRPFALVHGDAWFLCDPAAARTEFADDHIVVAAGRELANELLAVLDDVPGSYALRTAPVTITVIDPQR